MPVPKKPRRKTAPAKVWTLVKPKTSRAKAGPRSAPPEAVDEDALSQAQQMIYDAWNRTTSRSRIALAKKALALSPLCADAYNLMARDAKTATEAKELYAHGVEAGALALGPTGFEDYDGEFWGFLETRPYMRARHGLALTLQTLGDETAALDHFAAMLKLNPGDNQGIRYLLLAGLLRQGDDVGVKALLASYDDEWSANWLYTRALLAFRNGDASKPATRKLLDDARSVNEHVSAILAGTKPMVGTRGGFITMGGPDEATDYVREFGDAWKITPGAIEWLAGTAEPATPKKRSGKRTA